jgi:hypothetical protein
MNRPIIKDVNFVVEDDEDMTRGHLLPIHEPLCGVQFGDNYRQFGPELHAGLEHNLEMLGVTGLPAYESIPWEIRVDDDCPECRRGATP